MQPCALREMMRDGHCCAVGITFDNLTESSNEPATRFLQWGVVTRLLYWRHSPAPCSENEWEGNNGGEKDRHDRVKYKDEKCLSQRRRRKERERDWVHGNIEPQSIYVRSKLILIFGKRSQ